jgi:hypothetical protein
MPDPWSMYTALIDMLMLGTNYDGSMAHATEGATKVNAASEHVRKGRQHYLRTGGCAMRVVGYESLKIRRACIGWANQTKQRSNRAPESVGGGAADGGAAGGASASVVAGASARVVAGLAALSQAYVAASLRPSSCVPDSTVLTTFVNEHHAAALRLQASAMPPCLSKRYLAVCSLSKETTGMSVPSQGWRLTPPSARMPIECMHWGQDGTSAAADYSATPTRSFTSVTWVRWEAMHLALHANVRRVLWLDADVIVVRNPFLYARLHDAAHPNVLSEIPPDETGAATSSMATQPAAGADTFTSGLSSRLDGIQARFASEGSASHDGAASAAANADIATTKAALHLQRWAAGGEREQGGLVYQQEYALNASGLPPMPQRVHNWTTPRNTWHRPSYALRDVVHFNMFGANMNTGVLLASSERMVRPLAPPWHHSAALYPTTLTCTGDTHHMLCGRRVDTTRVAIGCDVCWHTGAHGA